MSLTNKQRLFVEAYLVDGKGKNAAVAAGYSQRTASIEANRLLKNPRVLAEIERRKKLLDRPAKVDANLASVAAAAGFDISKAVATRDALEFLIAVFNDPMTEPKLRVDSAKAVVPYQHAKKGEGGKKELRDEAAKKVASKFAPAAPPKLVAAGGKKV
ncbi:MULTISPECIES: terminase small subunit [unclassified Caballeronia]|uniref:terminase small subunit n=1 Tax=unclassified Caballeronia TaxID=2646786 RepID=UPI002856CBF3|nr:MULTISPECIES: terminase small subunit [unclassified Caballeronia]MDR5777543.1 terminase small subunit [Caballeronia sp. LZ002]MDR5800439.1 terminase small subunit [Caballeronia sp. LZ001]MDR5801498.1 terminase small subunit [Caballeronia sp. LZ001]MDR5853009.1 terminase small subunit [Caballeronia sp. LZ003]